MSENTTTRAVAAVKFKWQKDEKTYDYFIPEGLDVADLKKKAGA